MSDNLKDILSHLNPDIDQDTLLQYLQGKLSAEKQHELEQQMMDADFESDALEGLQAVKDKQHLGSIVEQLNSSLKKKTHKRRLRRESLKLKHDPSIWIAIVIFLLLIVISYFIIHRLLQQ
jgi:hypothetical protein